MPRALEIPHHRIPTKNGRAAPAASELPWRRQHTDPSPDHVCSASAQGLILDFLLLKNPLRRPLKSHPAPGAVAELEACRGYPISKGGRIEKGNFPEIAVPTSCIVTGGNASSSCTPGLLPCRDPIPNHLTIPNHLPSTRRTPPSSVPGRQGQAEKGKAGRMSSRPYGKCEESREAQGEGSRQLSPTLAALGGGGERRRVHPGKQGFC